MSLQVLKITLNNNNALLDDKILGYIYIDTDTSSVNYIDTDGNPEHIVLFDDGGTGGNTMLKSVYDANNDGIVDNTYLFNGQPAIYYATAAELLSKGDMYKSIYDSNNDGVINDSDRLGGQLPTYYADKAYVDALFASITGIVEEDFDATAGQTTFTVTGGYTVGRVHVFIDGVKLRGTEFTASNGTSVILNEPCSLNDWIQIVKY